MPVMPNKIGLSCLLFVGLANTNHGLAENSYTATKTRTDASISLLEKRPGTPPKFTDAQKAAFCLANAMLSVIATYISKNDCTMSDGYYPYNITVPQQGSGNATISGANQGITWLKLQGQLIDKTFLGQKCKVTMYGQPAIVNDLSVNKVRSLYSYDGENAGLVGDTDFIGMGEEHYAESVAREYLAVSSSEAMSLKFIPNNAATNPNTPASMNTSWSMEIVSMHSKQGELYTKLGYPQDLWSQQSYHWPSKDNYPGVLHMQKTRIVPSFCSIELHGQGTDTTDDGFNESGAIVVKNLRQ
jgi:hypothetical protein